MKRNKGFTLIELLVVIAIIGILSAIVLSSVNQARDKAQDSKIQSHLAGMRAAAEIYYNNNSNNYGPTFSGNGLGCSQSASLFGDSDSGMQALASSTPNIVCASTDTQWVAVAPLISEPTTFWCVDNTGASRLVTSYAAPLTAFPDPSNPNCPAS